MTNEMAGKPYNIRSKPQLETLHFKVENLKDDRFIEILKAAYANCREWWFDKLDCRESFCRQKVDIKFEEALRYYSKEKDVVGSIVIRSGSYGELGFCTFGVPSYFLWIITDVEFVEELKLPLKFGT